MDSRETPGASPDASAHEGPWRALIVAIACAALVAALAVLILSAMTPSSARVAATTTSDGLLSAGTVDLSRPGDATSVFFDTDGLYPGVDVRGCIVAQYDGSVDALIRIAARPDSGSGLDEFIELRLTVLPGDTCPPDGNTGWSANDAAGESGTESDAEAATDVLPVRQIFSGRLDDFWRTHTNFATGLNVAPVIESGDRIVIEAVVEVVDDNRAAGLDTEMTFVFEGRPA